jgi:hypothetical protein
MGKKKEKTLICEYCMRAITESESKVCLICNKVLCIFHEKPEEHHCKGVDWERLERKKQEESEALVASYRRRLKTENAFKLVGLLILLCMVYLFLTNTSVMTSVKNILAPSSIPVNENPQQNLTTPSTIPVNGSTPQVSSTEDSCSVVLSPERYIITDKGYVLGEWFYGPQLNPGFSFTTSVVLYSPICQFGSSVGQSVSHLYCKQNMGTASPVAERTNISKDGVIISKECYNVYITELAPSTEELPGDYGKYPEIYQGWNIVGVTCQRC